MKENFNEIKNHGTLLLSESLENNLKMETFFKDLKNILPQSVELKLFSNFGGLLSFCPLKDCFLLYALNPLDSFVRIEFFSLGECLQENIQKYRDVCKGLFLDINHYFEN